MKSEFFIIFIVSQLIGNVINLEMTQQLNDERDYENETAMKIDETMVNLKQSTFDPDAEFIMISSSRSDYGIKRRKRQAEENPSNEAPEDNPNENESPVTESFTAATEDPTDEEPSVNLEVETSITKGPTTTFIGGIPLSLITRPNTTTSTTTFSTTTTTKGTVMKGKVTYYTKKPLIFPSETTTKFTVGPLVRQEATTAPTGNHKAGMAAQTPKNMKIVSTTRKGTTKMVQKKVEGTKKTTKLMTKSTVKAKMATKSTIKAKLVTNSIVKTTAKATTTRKVR